MHSSAYVGRGKWSCSTGACSLVANKTFTEEYALRVERVGEGAGVSAPGAAVVGRSLPTDIRLEEEGNDAGVLARVAV